MTEAQQLKRIYDLWQHDADFPVLPLWRVLLKKGYSASQIVVSIEACGRDHPGYAANPETLELMQAIACGREVSLAEVGI